MFTVVIPLYNKAHIVLRSLASVLTQTYQNFELLIVNDGSTDNSVEIIRQFSSDPRIRIIDQKNQGVSVARNTGVKFAKYEYIAFLDADDEWLPGYLQKMYEAIQLFPSAAIYGCASWHRDILTGDTGNSLLNRYKDKIQIAEYFENPQAMPHISAIVVSKEKFNKVDNGDAFPIGMKCCEDWCCLNRLAFLGDFIYVGFSLGIKNNSVTGQITGGTKDQHFKLLRHIVDFYNLTHAFSLDKPDKLALYKLFFKYDLRNRIICYLRENDYIALDFLFKELDSGCLGELKNYEINLYKLQKLNFFAKLYIYFTKLIWRRYGFPIVGKP
jgi:glycosyltransferase involved in cell wall biosynthesis